MRPPFPLRLAWYGKRGKRGKRGIPPTRARKSSSSRRNILVGVLRYGPFKAARGSGRPRRKRNSRSSGTSHTTTTTTTSSSSSSLSAANSSQHSLGGLGGRPQLPHRALPCRVHVIAKVHRLFTHGPDCHGARSRVVHPYCVHMAGGRGNGTTGRRPSGEGCRPAVHAACTAAAAAKRTQCCSRRAPQHDARVLSRVEARVAADDGV